MNDYQEKLIEIFSDYRPSPSYPTYPPYHEGLYLEDYFFKWFVENNIKTERFYIPVFWTTCYVENTYFGLQDILKTLDPSLKYFTVAQHDDAIRERLPIDTISFNAGGNGGGIPIPLVCSPIKDEIKPDLEKDIFCSFVGSITHPIRNMMYQTLINNPKYVISARNWTSSVSENDFNNFQDTIYDKYNVPGYLIYRNKYYIFQPFDQNEDVVLLFLVSLSIGAILFFYFLFKENVLSLKSKGSVVFIFILFILILIAIPMFLYIGIWKFYS